jgi:hypothetical protein
MSSREAPAVCPNCTRPHAGLVTHECRGPRAYWRLGTTHCGCYYEAAPADVVDHVTRDCVCGPRAARVTS